MRDRHSHTPLLGNLDGYGVDAHQRKRLWDLEIRRLRQLNLSAEEALKPRIEPDILLEGKIEGKAFRELESLAHAIRLTLFVCIVDDAREADPNMKDSSSFALECLEVLSRFVNMDNEPAVPGVNPGSELGSWYQKLKLPEGTRTSETEKLRISTTFHYLIDQITATVAQIAIRVSESEYWLVVVLACLAKLATKMKVIHSNLYQFVKSCVVGAAYWASEHKSRSRYRFMASDYGDFEDDGQQRPALSDDSPIVERHVREHLTVSSWLAKCITTILRNLGDKKPWWTEDSYIDSCTSIFDTGLEPTGTILHQNNHGSLSGSSDKITVSFSSVALETVWKLGDMITAKTLNTYPDNTTIDQSELYIEFHLDLEEGGSGRGRRWTPDRPTTLLTIIDYIILVIPLSLADPIIGEGYRDTLHEISSLSAFGIPITRQIQIRGFVALKQNKPMSTRSISKLGSSLAVPESEEIARSGNPQNIHYEVSSSLLGSFLLDKRRCLLDRKIIPKSETTHLESALTLMKLKLRPRNKHREEILRIATKWTIQEKAIVVPCPRYVLTVAFLTFILVAGGVTCAFVVGERIPGVDPSNLTNFSWLVGGLSILVAKSMRVSDWTWRDFLSGRVSCRTVQELSDVSGLEPQDILFFLLSSQMHGIVLPSGPFQEAFSRNSKSDGFSIDVKPNLQTLLASGIVLVHVLTLEGPALLWLRLVPGDRKTHVVRPSGTTGTTKGRGFLGWRQPTFGDSGVPVCRDPPRFQGDGDAIITLEQSIRWIKVLGLYNLKDAEFR